MRDAQALLVADCIRDIPLPAFVMTERGSTVYKNPAYRARFGARKGQAAHELAAALRRGRASHLRAAMAGASRVVALGPIVGAPLDAHYFPVDACYFPIREASGAAEFVGVVLVESREATALRLAADAEAPDVAEAAASAEGLTAGAPTQTACVPSLEQSLRIILDGMPQLVWSSTPDGFDDFRNRRYYEYTGLDRDAMRGAGWNTVLHPDDQQRAWERWQRAVATGRDYEVECRYRRADGQYRWFLLRGVPMRDEHGRIVRWFGTCTDIDDQKRLEQQRAEVLAQAEANSRMKDEFLATVSHELRTPLTLILAPVEDSLADAVEPLPPGQRARLMTIFATRSGFSGSSSRCSISRALRPDASRRRSSRPISRRSPSSWPRRSRRRSIAPASA
jgi:PAS domain S-box-containing protein